MSDPAKLQRSPALNFALKKSVLRNERHSRLLDYLIGVPYLWSQCSKKGGTKELSECVCVLKWERREGGCEREITQAEGRAKTVETERRKWAVKTVLSYRSSVCLEESEVALGLLLLPLASGEAAPGSPGGTEAIVWDTVLAAKLWPSNKPNTTRVSPRPDAQHLTAVMNIPLTSFNWGTNLAARGYHVGWSIQKQVSSKQRETKRQQADRCRSMHADGMWRLWNVQATQNSLCLHSSPSGTLSENRDLGVQGTSWLQLAACFNSNDLTPRAFL